MDLREFLPPQAQAASWLAENGVKLVAGLILGGLLLYMGWRTFLAPGQAQAKHDVVQAQGRAAIAKAGQDAGAAAVPIITNNYYGQQKSDRQTQENSRAILQAPGAGQPIDPALAAVGRRAICMRASAAGLPECQQLLNPGP